MPERRPKSRGNGEGSLVKLGDGRWQAQITIWRDGKRAFVRRIRKTRKEAADALTDLLGQQRRGQVVVGGHTTLRAFLATWLDTVATPTVKPATADSYRRNVERHICPALGHHTLTALAPHHLATFYKRLLDAGLSTRTVRLQHTLIHAALSVAVAWSLAPRNVAALVRPPALVPTRRPVALSPAQVRTFLQAATGDRYHAFYLTFLTTGLRPSELFALRWSDVDLPRAMLVVRDSKTASGIRPVPLPAVTVAALTAHQADQAAQRELAGSAWRDPGLVFATSHGGPLRRWDIAHQSFKRLLVAAGLPDIRLYDLRHTHATLLMELGISPKVAAERLGHHSAAFTLDVYSHAGPHIQRDAADRLDTVFGGVP